MRTLYHTTYLDDDREIGIEYTQTPFIPARISGPPEDCYPAEGGDVEIIDVSVKTDDGWADYAATDEEIEAWAREIESLPIEDDGPDPDYEYDRMRDERMGL